MCIPADVKFYTIIAIVSFFMFYEMTENNGVDFFIMFILSFFTLFIKCPKCGKPVGETINGWYGPIHWYKCDKCQQNLWKCRIDD